ncbi:MAG: bifunctional (p)ppGpp synthetase/guanosine-3',5'-bis(diphosphate) 3'-pyrophosphohydrolase [Pedobacter sp.]|nr:MAG: bifunctional (p)ppGpp synthetase/guanosine-3',5'-bis(diphosphate) 3'-pyrophosphohydrolase [Pedobacter sp.]
MDTVSLLEKIRVFADEVHGEQLRKYTPERYIVHPVRVMELCREYDNRLEILAAAFLHDVVEDTPVSLLEIETFLKTLMPAQQAKKIRKLVDELTDVYIKQDYPHLNRNKRKELENERLSKVSADAQTIKYADLIDNCLDIVPHDPGLGRKFISEALALLSKATQGNADLRKRAIQIISTM